MISIGAWNGQRTGDPVDLDIRVQAILLHMTDNIIELQVSCLDVVPHPACIFTAGGPDGKFPLQDILIFIEEGKKGAVEFQPLLRGYPYKNCVQDAFQLNNAEIGRVHLQSELVQELGPEIRRLQFFLEKAVIDGQSPLFKRQLNSVIKDIGHNRFGQVVIRPYPEAIQGRLEVCCPRDHDDTEVGKFRCDVGKYFHAIPVRQADIQQDQGHFPGIEKFGKPIGAPGFTD